MGEHLLGLAFQLVGHPLHVVGAAQRIGHAGHAGLVGDDLLATQGDAGRLGAG